MAQEAHSGSVLKIEIAGEQQGLESFHVQALKLAQGLGLRVTHLAFATSLPEAVRAPTQLQATLSQDVGALLYEQTKGHDVKSRSILLSGLLKDGGVRTLRDMFVLGSDAVGEIPKVGAAGTQMKRLRALAAEHVPDEIWQERPLMKDIAVYAQDASEITSAVLRDVFPYWKGYGKSVAEIAAMSPADAAQFTIDRDEFERMIDHAKRYEQDFLSAKASLELHP